MEQFEQGPNNEVRAEILREELQNWTTLLEAIRIKLGDKLATPLHPYETVSDRNVNDISNQHIEHLWESLNNAPIYLHSPVSAREFEEGVMVRVNRLKELVTIGDTD